MRRLFLPVVAVSALLLAAAASPASAAPRSGGWVPAPSAPFDLPAGTRCDFPVHSEPIVDEVRTRVLATFPDGSTKREAYIGDLVVRITNTATGASVDVDLSGSALVEYQPGGTLTRNSTWYLVGPAMFGFGEGGGDHPRGLWVFDGRYKIEFGPTSYKTVTTYHGTGHDVCTDLN
jgi:hypothetical protein